jgi:hypothetical protein
MKTLRNIIGLLIGGFLLLNIQSCVVVERDYPNSQRIVILKSRAPYYYQYKNYRPYTPPPKYQPYRTPPGQWKQPTHPGKQPNNPPGQRKQPHKHKGKSH